MSVEISDLYADGISHCCSAAVIDPSGENIEGICADCKEHCSVINEQSGSEMIELYGAMQTR